MKFVKSYRSVLKFLTYALYKSLGHIYREIGYLRSITAVFLKVLLEALNGSVVLAFGDKDDLTFFHVSK